MMVSSHLNFVERAMGIHFVNGGLVVGGALDPAQPEALLYEDKNGHWNLRVTCDSYIAGDTPRSKSPTYPCTQTSIAGDAKSS